MPLKLVCVCPPHDCGCCMHIGMCLYGFPILLWPTLALICDLLYACTGTGIVALVCLIVMHMLRYSLSSWKWHHMQAQQQAFAGRQAHVRRAIAHLKLYRSHRDIGDREGHGEHTEGEGSIHHGMSMCLACVIRGDSPRKPYNRASHQKV